MKKIDLVDNNDFFRGTVTPFTRMNKILFDFYSSNEAWLIRSRCASGVIVKLNTDAEEFGGSGVSAKSYKSENIPMHGFDNSISMTLAPLSVMYLKTSVRKKTVSTDDKVIAEPKKTNTKTGKKKTADNK